MRMTQYRMYYFLRFIRQVDHLLQGTTIGKGTLTNLGHRLRYLYFPQRTAIGKSKTAKISRKYHNQLTY